MPKNSAVDMSRCFLAHTSPVKVSEGRADVCVGEGLKIQPFMAIPAALRARGGGDPAANVRTDSVAPADAQSRVVSDETCNHIACQDQRK